MFINKTTLNTFKMGFLCKEQVIKGLYLAIGSKHNVPKDLLLIIYRLTKDDSEVRQYHMNKIYHNAIPNYMGSTKFPLNRGLEWAIKWEKDRRKKVLHCQIHVFGDRDYLLKRCYYVDARLPGFQYFFKRAHCKLKFLYLKTSPMDEVMEDYSEYLEHDMEPEYRLYIDHDGLPGFQFGDGEIFIDSETDEVRLLNSL